MKATLDNFFIKFTPEVENSPYFNKLKKYLPDYYRWNKKNIFYGKKNGIDECTEYSNSEDNIITIKEFMTLLEPFKEGDIVEVRENESQPWTKRVYIYTDKNGRINCVSGSDIETNEDKYLNNKSYSTYDRWNYIRKVQQDKIELTLTINGQEISPSEISKETWNSLRNKN